MKLAAEKWDEWDWIAADGIPDIPWSRAGERRAAEPVRAYASGSKKKAK